MRALLLVAMVGTARAEDATDAAARASIVEVVERPAPPARSMSQKHMQSPALVVTGSVLAVGSTIAIAGVSAAAASGDPVWQPIAPFVILATAGALTGAISMIIVGAWQVPF